MKKTMLARMTRPLLHWIVILCLYIGLYHLRQYTDGIPSIQLRIPTINTTEMIRFALMSASIFVWISLVKGLYTLHSSAISPTKSYRQSFWPRAGTIAMVAYLGQGFVFQFGISRAIIVWSIVGVVMIVPLLDMLWVYIYTHWMASKAHTLLVIYTDASYLTPEIQDIHLEGYTPEYIDIHDRDRQTLGQTTLLIGTIAPGLLQTIVDIQRLTDTTLYHIPHPEVIQDTIYIHTTLDDVSVIQYTDTQLSGRAQVYKRGFDILVSTIAIIMLSPIMLITALIIKTTSAGPVLYMQPRIGKNGRPFTFVKFRSMYTHLSVGEGYGGADAWKLKQDLMNSDLNIRKGELQKIHNDPRITPIGRWIRKTSIDELPSLFLVLRGTMSLIGPRPHEPFEVARYKPRHKRVLSIKPGITGYAQIFGRHTQSFDDEARRELIYIQHRTLWLDIYILIKTAGVVCGYGEK